MHHHPEDTVRLPGSTDERPFVIRPMTLADCEVVCHLHMQCGLAAPTGTPDPTLWWLHECIRAVDAGIALVIERHGRLIGALCCPPGRPGDVILGPVATMWGDGQDLARQARAVAAAKGLRMVRARTVIEYEEV